MSREAFEANQAIAGEIRRELGEVVVAVSDRAVHVDPGAAVHAIVERLMAIEARITDVERRSVGSAVFG